MMFRSILKYTLLSAALMCAPQMLTSCGSDEPDVSGTMLLFPDDNRVVTLDDDNLYVKISFIARTNWTAVSDAAWLEVSPASGAGGNSEVTFSAASNDNGEPRTAIVTIKAGTDEEKITVTQTASELKVLRESDVKDFDKYYKPKEFSGMDMLRSDAKWSWVRSKQSEHFFVFWEASFGSDPNSENVPAALRVDIDDLLLKAERFYDTNINRLKMANVGQGQSYLDKYKMEIYLLYQSEWLATGSGYDNTIGALWVNPSTCQPVGSVIAHEIGHSFQYQVYCDKVLNGASDDLRHGFRYGYPDSNGGCGYWEQCAQWQSFQDYPVEQFTGGYFEEWVNTSHRHFEHEWHRYASYWLQTYWVEKHGVEAYGNIWRLSSYPDDAIQTYTRLYNGGDYSKTREELFDYAARMATFDITGMREYADNYQGRYRTTMLRNADGAWQPAYSSCPGATGFNVIALNVPAGGGKVTVDFSGLTMGSSLLPDDPGQMVDGDGKPLGTTSTYNKMGTDADMGWRYGFVAYSGGKRTYSDVGKNRDGQLSFTVPADATALYFVVQGSPETYKQCPWDELEYTDYQYPYAVKFTNTNLYGYFDIDTSADPKDVALSYEFRLDASSPEYAQGTIELGGSLDLCQAFVMTSDVFASRMLAVGKQPEEGKVAVMCRNTDGSLDAAGKANNGFWLDAEGNNSSWGDNGFTFFEMDGLNLTFGHYPGHVEAGKSYQLRPTLVYTKDGHQYRADITITLQY